MFGGVTTALIFYELNGLTGIIPAILSVQCSSPLFKYRAHWGTARKISHACGAARLTYSRRHWDCYSSWSEYSQYIKKQQPCLPWLLADRVEISASTDKQLGRVLMSVLVAWVVDFLHHPFWAFWLE